MDERGPVASRLGDIGSTAEVQAALEGAGHTVTVVDPNILTVIVYSVGYVDRRALFADGSASTALARRGIMVQSGPPGPEGGPWLEVGP